MMPICKMGEDVVLFPKPMSIITANGGLMAMLLAKESASAILGDAGMTILIGVVVVFCMLLLLTGVFKLFGLIMTTVGSGKQRKPAKAVVIAPPASVSPAAPAAPAGNTRPVTTTPTVQNGIPEDTVAAISAAVAATAPDGVQYAVRSIRKK